MVGHLRRHARLQWLPALRRLGEAVHAPVRLRWGLFAAVQCCHTRGDSHMLVRACLCLSAVSRYEGSQDLCGAGVDVNWKE